MEVFEYYEWSFFLSILFNKDFWVVAFVLQHTCGKPCRLWIVAQCTLALNDETKH